MAGEQVIVEKKSQTYVLYGFFAVVCVAIVVRVAFGSMSSAARVGVCVVAGALGVVCGVALVRTAVREPGRMVIGPTGVTKWAASGRWETIDTGPLRVRRASKNWFLSSAAGHRTAGGPEGTPTEQVAGGMVLFGYDVRQVVQACADAGWAVDAAGATARPQRG